MAYDVMVILDDSPGELARLGEVAGAAGVNLDGFAAFTGDGKGVVHALVSDDPSVGGVRLVFGTDDVTLARSILDA